MKPILALALALILSACQTDQRPVTTADTRPTSVNPISPPKGPQRALGAVLFVDGGDYRERSHNADNVTPFVLRNIEAVGFDVFRLDLAPSDQHAEAIFDNWLPSTLGALRRQGYKKVYVVGQSAGGMAALIAVRTDLRWADGAVAFAPGWSALQPVATQIQLHRDTMQSASNSRVAIFHFRNDELIGNWHEQAVAISRQALGNRRNAMIRVPPNVDGHLAFQKTGFFVNYGPCIAQFLAAEEVDGSVCPP